MEKLKETQALLVQQKKEWGEVLTGFETKNKYAILDTSGEQIYRAAEESSILCRWLLKRLRPFTIHIVSSQENSILTLKKPFKLFLHDINILDPYGKQLGMIKQKFSVFSKKFIVKDSTGREIYKIFGPFIHPWTFRILKNDREVGKISKKWTGLGKEVFTDADNFNVTFPSNINIEQKAILLGVLFLIDMLYFEK